VASGSNWAALGVREWAPERVLPRARPNFSITPDTYSHAIPATQAEAAALIAGLVFASE
jgi:hypothetical protein